jgi:hypothetical protein
MRHRMKEVIGLVGFGHPCLLLASSLIDSNEGGNLTAGKDGQSPTSPITSFIRWRQITTLDLFTSFLVEMHVVTEQLNDQMNHGWTLERLEKTLSQDRQDRRLVLERLKQTLTQDRLDHRLVLRGPGRMIFTLKKGAYLLFPSFYMYFLSSQH